MSAVGGRGIAHPPQDPFNFSSTSGSCSFSSCSFSSSTPCSSCSCPFYLSSLVSSCSSQPAAPLLFSLILHSGEELQGCPELLRSAVDLVVAAAVVVAAVAVPAVAAVPAAAAVPASDGCRMKDLYTLCLLCLAGTVQKSSLGILSHRGRLSASAVEWCRRWPQIEAAHRLRQALHILGNTGTAFNHWRGFGAGGRVEAGGGGHVQHVDG